MSLPINRKALDLSLLDSLSQGYHERPNELLRSLIGDPATESPTMSTPRKSTESFSNYTVEFAGEGMLPRAEYDRRRQRDYEMLVMLQQRYEPVPEEMFLYASESLRRAMDTKANEVISASLAGSTPSAPSRSSTDQSNCSGASLTTSFLSRTSAKNSKSNPSTSRSGLPKLLSSPSKAIATKSSTQS